MKEILFTLIASLFFIVPQTSHAVSINFISPDMVSSTNTSDPNPPMLAPTNLIDGSLSATTVTLDNIGTVIHSNTAGSAWRGDAGAIPITLTFGFNTVQTIGHIGLWQAFELREGTGSFDLTFFDELNGTGNQIGGVFSSILDDGSGGIGSISLAGHAFDVGARSGVRSVTMEITSIALQVNPFVHLGEFMVAPTQTVTPVPEPSTYLLLSTGLVSLIVWRRWFGVKRS